MTFSSGVSDSLDMCVSKALRHGRSEEAAFVTTSEVVRELEALEPHFDDVECVRALKKLVSTFVAAHGSSISCAALHSSSSSSPASTSLPSLDSFVAAVGEDTMRSLETEFARTLEQLHDSRGAAESLKEGANVLRFDGEGNDGYLWHHLSSTDLFDTELCKNSKQVDDALAVVQQFVGSSSSPTASDSDGKRTSPTANMKGGTHKSQATSAGKTSKGEGAAAAASASSPRTSFLSSLVLLLQNSPDLLVQTNNWEPLLAAMTRVALQDPDEAAKALHLYFDLAGSQQRLDLLQLMCKSVVKTSAGPFVALVLQLVRKLPENWISLADDAVEALLLLILEAIVVAHTEVCSAEDPQAQWLLTWLSNPTLFYRVVQQEAFVKLVRKISDKAPSSHATACVIVILPRLAAHVHEAEDKTSGARKSVEYIFANLLAATMDSSLSEDIYAMAASAVSRTAPFITKAERRQKCAHIIARLPALEREEADVQVRCATSSLFIISHLAACADLHDTSLLLSDEQCACLDEYFVTKVSRWSDETVISSFHDFLQLLLPLHWKKFPKTVEAIIHACASDHSHLTPSAAFSPTQLVYLSQTVEGWAHVCHHLQRKQRLHASCFDALLDALLEVQKEGRDLNFGKSELRPVSFALLQRWCLVQDVQTGLFDAVTRRLECANNRLNCPFVDERGKMWVMLFPVEMYCGFHSDGNPLENTPAQDSAHQQIAFLQTLRAFLWLLNPSYLYAACHPDFQATFDPAKSTPISLVVAEIATLYNVTNTDKRQSDEPPSPLTATFGEDSLLYLLNLAALLVLLDPFAAQFLWRDPHAMQQRRALRLLCQDRRGVDPVYFVLRFLTSSKGWKRLGPIFVGGFQAELKVDVVISVSSFADGEAEPPALTGAPISEEIARAIAKEAFPALSPPEAHCMTPLVQCLMYVYNESENPTAATVELLQKRTHDDWVAFRDTRARSLAVAALLETNTELVSLLCREGIDAVYLSSLCVGNWLQSLFPHNARCAPPFLASVDLFANGSGGGTGTACWDEAVAKQLAAFALKMRGEMLKLETEEDVAGERLIPLTYTTPIPSPLFALLIARPFTISSQK